MNSLRRELGRVSRRQVALVYDASVSCTFWLAEYFTSLGMEPSVASPSAGWIDGYLDLV